MVRSLLLVFVTIFAFNMCTTGKRGEERTIGRDAHEKLWAGCGELADSEMVVYYFDADCALCMAEVLALEKHVEQKGDRKALFIAKTLSPERFAYQAEQHGVKSCILFDTEGFFDGTFDLNKKVLLLENQVFVDYEF